MFFKKINYFLSFKIFKNINKRKILFYKIDD